MSDNVIKFPKSFKKGTVSVPDYEEVQENLEFKKIYQIMEVSSSLFDSIVEDLGQLGYDFPIGTRMEKDFFFVFEAIKSMIAKYHDEEHELQILANHSILLVDDEEESGYSFIPPTVKLKSEESGSDDSIGC